VTVTLRARRDNERLEGALKDHLQECADRYRALQSLIVRTAFAVGALLLAIIGWLIAHGPPLVGPV
jgi:hypothetical protein